MTMSQLTSLLNSLDNDADTDMLRVANGDIIDMSQPAR